jgi:hypothetical protein
MSRLKKLLKESVSDPEIKIVLTQTDLEQLCRGFSIRKECPGRSPVRLVLATVVFSEVIETLKKRFEPS